MEPINNVKEDILETSEALRENFERLEQRLVAKAQSFSPVEKIKEHPEIAMAIAVVTGVAVGHSLTKAGDPRQPSVVRQMGETTLAVVKPFVVSTALSLVGQLARNMFPEAIKEIEKVESALVHNLKNNT